MLNSIYQPTLKTFVSRTIEHCMEYSPEKNKYIYSQKISNNPDYSDYTINTDLMGNVLSYTFCITTYEDGSHEEELREYLRLCIENTKNSLN